MRQSVRFWMVLSLTLTLLAAPAALAQGNDENAQLRQASELFEKQDYATAKSTLDGIDRNALSERDQDEFDLLQKIVLQAIAANESAREALAGADQALERGEFDEAAKLYQTVLENEYARAELKDQAQAKSEALAMRRASGEKPSEPAAAEAASDLAEAAEPTGVVEVEVEEETAPAQPAMEQPRVAEAPFADMTSRRRTPLDDLRQRDELLWQHAETQARNLSKQAREAVAENRFTEARQLADFARQKLDAASNLAEPRSRYIAARDAVIRLSQEIADAEATYSSQLADRERTEVVNRIRERERLLEAQRQEKISQLFLTAGQLRDQQRYEEAAEVLRQILAIDPANAKARDQLEMADDYASLLAQRAWEENYQTQSRKSLLDAQQALIPWSQEVLYPKNWLELTARRSTAGLGASGEQEDSELNRKLDDVLPEFDFQDAPLEAVMDHLMEIQQINIAVDWEDLENNGIDRDKPVTIQLRGLTFRTVLREVLAQIGGDIKLGFSVDEGLLRIATKDKLDQNKFVLVYDIRDLLVNVPRFNNAATMDPSQALNQAGQGGQGGGGGGSNQLFQSNNRGNEQRDEVDNTGLVERIMEIIRQTVEPDSWVETGGGDGSIRELNGQLIIYNTSDSHSQIRGLLDQLRATRALQIALEARFLNVTSNFLEEFGVDLDFVFNSGSAGYDRALTTGGAALTDPVTGAFVLMPRQFSRIGSTANTPGFGNPLPQVAVQQPYGQAGFVPSGTGVSPHFSEMTPISSQQNSISLADPSTLTTGVPGSFAQQVTQPALNIAGSFLDNLQVDFLIRATQANARSTIVQAPRLVMFNGQRSNISIGRSRTYVSSVTPQIAEGAVGVQPVTNQAPSGTVLVVEGTISADRKYVTVTVEASQTEEPTFERFEVQRASGNSPGIFILLPDQAFVTVNTTVSIPDGGTVLLGGLKQVGEAEVEAGVPILSHIPIIKRAFTNKSRIKDTRTLLVLMKAKIIIQQEAEQEAFPTFSSVGS